MRTVHPQVWIKHDGQRAPVDHGIAPLILALWRFGATTTGSCQELNPGEAWIVFPTRDDAGRMAGIIGPAARVAVVVFDGEAEARVAAQAADDPHVTAGAACVLFPSRLIPRATRRIKRMSR